MSCCPSVRCRNIGSGYVKESATEKSSELDARMKELMSARNEQDIKIWSPVVATSCNTTSETATSTVGSTKRLDIKRL